MSTDVISTALAPVNSLVSFISSGVDLASKVYEFSLLLQEAKSVDKVGVHIGPVIRATASGEWSQKLLLVFHRAAGGDTVKHHYNIDLKLTGNSSHDKQEQWSVKLEQIQATIMDQLDADSVKQVFDNIKMQTKQDSVSLIAAAAAVSTPSAPSPKHSKADKGDNSDNSAPSDLVSTAATIVNNLVALEKSFDSKRTVVLSRIGYVADSMLGGKVPEEDHWYEKSEVENYCERVKNLFANALFEFATVKHELRTYDAKKRYIDLVLNIRVVDGAEQGKKPIHDDLKA